MAGAGLTHGGFYSYFKSKSDLYAEVLGCFFTDPEWKICLVHRRHGRGADHGRPRSCG
jgi:AcrR family transcriptional regulator